MLNTQRRDIQLIIGFIHFGKAIVGECHDAYGFMILRQVTMPSVLARRLRRRTGLRRLKRR